MAFVKEEEKSTSQDEDSTQQNIFSKAKHFYETNKIWFFALVSILSLYDVFGDILYLSSFLSVNNTNDVETEYTHQLMLNTYDLIIAQGFSCTNTDFRFCEPLDPEPKMNAIIYSGPTSYANGGMIRWWNNESHTVWAPYVSAWDDTVICPVPDLHLSAVYATEYTEGASCQDAEYDITLAEDELIISLYQCLSSICGDCMNECRSGESDGSNSAVVFNDSILGVSIITCCDEYSTETTSAPINNLFYTMCDILLSIIIIKESLKVFLNLSYFLSIQCQKEYFLRFSQNSVIIWFLIFASKRFANDLLVAVKEKKRTLGLFADLFLEDIPQAIFPLWFMSFNNSKPNAITVISLSGSCIMLGISVVFCFDNMAADYKGTKSKQMNAMSQSKTKNTTNYQNDDFSIIDIDENEKIIAELFDELDGHLGSNQLMVLQEQEITAVQLINILEKGTVECVGLLKCLTEWKGGYCLAVKSKYDQLFNLKNNQNNNSMDDDSSEKDENELKEE